MNIESQAVLGCPMVQPNDADATTVRDYLVALVRRVWIEGEGFNGKRPFGNSSWKFEVYASLGRAGVIEATFDEDGYLDEVDKKTGNALVLTAIEQLGMP